MQTAREWLISELEAHGLWAHEARKVFHEYCENGMSGMAGRWDENIADYNMIVRAVMRRCAFHDAAEWIKANEPNHWAKDLFV